MKGVFKREEAIELVRELNYQLDDQYEGKNHDNEPYFDFWTDGTCEAIKFGELIFWNSEDDDREWIEKEGDVPAHYEDMKTFLIIKFDRFKKMMTQLELK